MRGYTCVCVAYVCVYGVGDQKDYSYFTGVLHWFMISITTVLEGRQYQNVTNKSQIQS